MLTLCRWVRRTCQVLTHLTRPWAGDWVSRSMRWLAAALLAALVALQPPRCRGYDNGLGRLPALGWNGWCTDGPCQRDVSSPRQSAAARDFGVHFERLCFQVCYETTVLEIAGTHFLHCILKFPGLNGGFHNEIRQINRRNGSLRHARARMVLIGRFCNLQSKMPNLSLTLHPQ